MTARPFERLVYTDCPPGGGREGRAGFQVQAQSPGVTPAQARLSIDTLLYSAQPTWVAEERSVAHFPLGFAHAADEGWGTAESRYLGKEVNGARMGNHFADCLLTKDPALYGMIRPAQLWSSSVWRSVPFETTECPPFDGFLEPGPLTNDVVVDWLLKRPHRSAVLGRLLTAIESPAGPRVAIVADTPEEALRWIAAATMLLPVRAALDVSFKVFVNNLASASQRIVAVPRSLNPDVTVGRVAGVFVLDADTDTTEDAPVSARAAFWVDRLCGASDPFDVLDAVELAETLGGPGDAAQTDAREIAWALCSGSDELRDPSALHRWLRQATPQHVAAHGEAVAALVIGRDDADVTTLTWLEWATTNVGLRVERQALRMKLLETEVKAARQGSPPPPERLHPVALDDDARRDAESIVSSAILIEADDDSAVERLLRVARRHSVTLSFPPLNERLSIFAEHWVHSGGATPWRDYDPDRWVLGDEILDLVNECLRTELHAGRFAAALPVIEKLWPRLADRNVDPSDELAMQLQVAAYRDAPAGERSSRLRTMITALDQGPYRTDNLGRVQRALLDWRVLRPDDALAFVAMLPADVPLDADIAGFTGKVVARRAERPDVFLLEALVALDRRGQLPVTQAIERLRVAKRSVDAFLTAARDYRSSLDDSGIAAAVARMADVDPTVLRIHAAAILDVCLESRTRSVGSLVMSRLDRHAALPVLESWRIALRDARMFDAIFAGLTWYAGETIDGPVRSVVAHAIGELSRDVGDVNRDAWINEVTSHLPTAPTQLFIELALAGLPAVVTPGRRGWRRRDGGD